MGLFNFFKPKKKETKTFDTEKFWTDKMSSDLLFVYEKYPDIAKFLVMHEVENYKIRMLADSIKEGRPVEFVAICDSVEKGFPYLCETEDETWVFDNQENPLRDSVEGIGIAIRQYKFGGLVNESKMNYWINRLLALANNGNIMAQAFICWRGGRIFPDGKYDGLLPQDVWARLKESYEGNILESCNTGDPYAQLAVAKYHDIDDEQKEKLYLSAIEKGLTDACYYYAKFLDLKRYVANGMTVDIPPHGTSEWQEYMRDELSLYKKGAELNNGILAGYCQFRLGDMYENGDGGVFKDVATAQMWYRRAYENGYENAKIYLDE